MEVTMEKGIGRAFVLTVSAAVAVAWVGGIGSSATAMAAGPKTEAGERLGRTIDRAIHAEGPFFTPAEQAVIRRKCGYAPGEWDGSQANMSNGVFTCTNGRRVADAEMRELMDVAGERIGRRVSAAMQSAEVREAIGRVADEATQRALSRLSTRQWYRH
jgi:hypothetical protein